MWGDRVRVSEGRERLMTAVLQHFVDRYMHHCEKSIKIYALLGFFEIHKAS